MELVEQATPACQEPKGPSQGHHRMPVCSRDSRLAAARPLRSAVCLLLIAFFAPGMGPSTVSAGGFRIYEQSASATGQSAAFTAQADDPSALYYNPAGMTQLRGIQFSAGTILIGGSTKFTSTNPPQFGLTASSSFDGSIATPPPSNFYITANLNDLGLRVGDVTVGLGFLSPFGTLMRWPETGPFATATTFAALELIDVKPTLAYRLNDQLSFGLGADIYTFFDFWGNGQAEIQFLSSGGPGLPAAGTRMEVNGKDTAAGFNVSLLYTPFRNDAGKPLANVGLIYRTQATLKLEGDFLANGLPLAEAESTLVLPQVITGGVALWPVRDQEREWKMEVNVDYTGWKSHRNLDIHLSNGQTIPVPRNWESTFTIMVGTEYKLLQPAFLPDWDVALRGGYWFSETPIPDTTFTPDVPGSDNHSISFGLGLTCKGNGRFLGLFRCGRSSDRTVDWGPKAIILDTAFQVLLYEDRNVSGNQQPLAIPGVVNGNYETTYYVGSVNLTAQF